jgi:hypothetical protein
MIQLKSVALSILLMVVIFLVGWTLDLAFERIWLTWRVLH